MPSQAYIGRVGGLAVALGVGAAIGGWGSGVAWADDSPGSAGSPASKNEADSNPATTKPDAADEEADTADASGPTDVAKRPALLRVVFGTGGSKRRAWTPEESTTVSARQTGSERPNANATKKRSRELLSADADTQHDATTGTVTSKRTLDTVSMRTDVAADPVERPAPVESLRALSTLSGAATPSAPTPSPLVVGVVRQVVSGVADAIMTPFAAGDTSGTPAEPSMWAMLAFARREFETAVRSPFAPNTPADRETTSETLGAVTAAEPETRTLVLTAFPAEADAILARTTLDPNPTVVVDGHHYYLGTLGDKKVIVAMTGIGMENAAATTETALNHFTPESGISVDAVVFVGVAGGSGRTQIGDVAVPARWTSDDGATWHEVDSDMLEAANGLTVDLESTDTIADPACRICGPFARLPLINLNREPQLFIGGDGSSDDNNNGAAFPSIPFGGAIFGPQPLAAPDFAPLFTGNFFQAIGPFLARGVVSNITGFLNAETPAVDAVDQETAAAQQVADAHDVPFLGIRGMSDGPGDPLNLPGYPFTFVVYKQIAADNAAIVTEAFLENWDGADT